MASVEGEAERVFGIVVKDSENRTERSCAGSQIAAYAVQDQQGVVAVSF